MDRRKSETIEVRVSEPAVQFVLKDVSADISAEDEDLITDALRSDMEGNLFFDQSGYYIFSREDKGVLLYILNNAIREKRAFSHIWEKDDAYVIIDPVEDPNDTETHRFKVGGPDGERSAYYLYLNFFHISPPTRATGPYYLYIHYEQDLTEKYKSEYPDAGVEKVAIVYAGTYHYTTLPSFP